MYLMFGTRSFPQQPLRHMSCLRCAVTPSHATYAGLHVYSYRGSSVLQSSKLRYANAQYAGVNPDCGTEPYI